MKTPRGPKGGAEIRDTVSHSELGEASISASSMKDARKARTDEALRAAMLTLLEREPLETITIRKICAQAEVHYATCFRHHSSKEALLDHLAKDQINRLIKLALPVNDADGDGPAFQTLCHYVDQHHALWSALLTGGAAGAMREELLNHALMLAAERSPEHPWLPVELATTCNVTLIVETLAWWLKQPREAYAPDTIARMLHRLLDSSGLLEGSDYPRRKK